MNSHNHELAGPIAGSRASDDLHRVVAELLDLTAGQDRIIRQYARLADRLQALADAQGWLAGERESLGEEPAASQWRRPGGVRSSAPPTGRTRCPGDPGS